MKAAHVGAVGQAEQMLQDSKRPRLLPIEEPKPGLMMSCQTKTYERCLDESNRQTGGAAQFPFMR
jgi:hypothetical protein